VTPLAWAGPSADLRSLGKTVVEEMLEFGHYTRVGEGPGLLSGGVIARAGA
jgi:hypothetical protein